MTRLSSQRVIQENMNERRPQIGFIGLSGFPVGFGAVQRMLLIAKGLIENGCAVKILCWKGVHGPDQKFPAEGTVEGIPYEYISGTIYRPRGFVKRNWMKMVGKFRELAYLRRLKRAGKLDYCLISTMDIDMLLIYRIWLKMIGVPMILDYVELNSAISSRTRIKERINDFFFDRYAVKLADAVTPISELLIDNVKTHAEAKPVHKLPILCDFGKFNPNADLNGNTRFVYCGAAAYRPVIDFILTAFHSFDLSASDRKAYLDLILGGSEEELKAVEASISQNPNREHIRVFPNVPHQSIPAHYESASALLIPLRPTLQDAARFPHKLGEYLASGKPVITTLFGEVKEYDFIDGETALVAPDYDPATFSAKMRYILDHPEEAYLIGIQGRKMGLKNFNYQTLGQSLKEFILSINH